MLTFLDGPAKGRRGLLIHRAPIYLRVVQAPDGSFDTLDQPEDTPRASETVHAYRRVSLDGNCHVSRTVKGRRVGGFYVMATYTLCDPQPADTILRDDGAWREWATEQHQASKKEATP
jgi:hypothetical protein